MQEEAKLQMFENRLLKVYKHKSKLARRQAVSCYRVYDHDLPEFPFCIELYGDKVYLAEYLRRHGMTDEEHEQWLSRCIVLISTLLEVPADKICAPAKRMSHRAEDQYEKLNEEKSFYRGRKRFTIPGKPYRLSRYRFVPRSPFNQANGARRIKR